MTDHHPAEPAAVAQPASVAEPSKPAQPASVAQPSEPASVAEPGGSGGSGGGAEVDVPSGRPARVRTPLPGDPRLARLSLNQRTVPAWPLPAAIAGVAAAGLGSIGLWREPVRAAGVAATRRRLDDAGLRVSTLCRGGFFTGRDPAERAAAAGSNRAAIDEAADLRAAALVLVPGGLPPGDRDLDGARARAADAVADLVPYARQRGVRLGIEPMHPIYAADRGVVSTLAQALDIAEQFPAGAVGVVVDTFHLWWEPGILAQLRRAGDRIVSYQVADWITPLPPDALLCRGVMGDGHVDFAGFTAAVAAAGYTGDVEVEIFNAEVWAAPPERVLGTVIRRYVELVEGALIVPKESGSGSIDSIVPPR